MDGIIVVQLLIFETCASSRLFTTNQAYRYGILFYLGYYCILINIRL